MNAYIAYSVQPAQAHIVHEMEDIARRAGYQVGMYYPQQDLQTCFDEVGNAMLFIGIVTHPRDAKKVIQLWQYAQRSSGRAYLALEANIAVPGRIGEHPDVIRFSRHQPENPIRFIQVSISHH